MKRLALALAVASFAFGCSSAPTDEPSTESTDSVSQEARAGAQCGPKRCAAGQVCCNESCGICTEPGGFCIELYCGDRSGKPGECTSDADCRLEADYCTGCDCRALATNEKLPHCKGPGVRCFADPCMNKGAVCVNGSCEVASY